MEIHERVCNPLKLLAHALVMCMGWWPVILFCLTKITLHLWAPMSFGLTERNCYHQGTDLEPSWPLLMFWLALLFLKQSVLYWNLDKVFEQSTSV